MQFFGAWWTSIAIYGSSEEKVRAVADGRRKLIDFGSHAELFDLVFDMAEQKNLIRELLPVEQLALLRLMPELPDVPITSGKEGEVRDLSGKDTEALRALGYLE